ncbi:PEP-utilizing enzyme [Ruminiclostridium cellulolyticum]|uniref:PEP-utilizing enzyme n=1 Tax=Ruminiclostridium cellulolyticum TaxID=1521 RepID=UPI0009D6EA3E
MFHKYSSLYWQWNESSSRVIGIIFEEGSPFDHVGIIAREMGIPALRGYRYF